MRARSARAASADGSALRWPGAVDRFALFAEVLYTGLIVTILSLGIVTVPLALAAAVRHLRRFVLAEGAGLSDVVADVRAGFVRSLPAGAATAALAAALVLDLVLVSSGILPGGVVVAVVCTALLAALAVVLLVAATSWSPASTWRDLLLAASRRAAHDLRGSLSLLAAVGLTVVVTWQLAPLVVPALGCLAFAALAVRLAAEARADAEASG